MSWLQLIRWKNLVIIFLTQLIVWWSVILPGAPKVLNLFNFLCLSLSTVLIAAAGYIINDYFDIKIDLINRPEKVMLEKTIPRKQAIISHTVLNLIALALAGFVAVRAHHYEWLLVQVGCTLLLWFYSTDFKRQFVTGNIVISLLTACTILTFVIYEPGILWGRQGHILSTPGWILLVYAYFAFMLTWMREVVKDMEDFIGDEAEGCKTMPVKKGLEFSGSFVLGLAVLAIFPLAVGSIILYRPRLFLLSAYLVLLILTIVTWCVFLKRGATPQHYSSASRGLKVVMLLGICSLLIYHLQLFADSVEE